MPRPCFTRPALILLLLSPAIGELLSSSAPPAEFFNPIGIVMLSALYGSGAILIRELKLYWRKGWLAVFLLGLAYAIVEEGMMCKSFFDPGWVDIGPLGKYGRLGGVNWAWTELLCGYHAVFSIAIPILLVELTFPERRNEHWVSPKCAIVLAVLMALDVVLGYFGLSKYRPPMGLYVVFVLLAGGLVFVAKVLDWPKAAEPEPDAKPVAKPWKFWLVGLLGGFCFMFTFYGLPALGTVPPLATMGVGLAAVVLTGWALVRMSGGGAAWSDIHRFWAAAGGLGVLIFSALVAEIDQKRPDNTTGMAAVAVIAVALLRWLRGKIAGRGDSNLPRSSS